jgi:hypothetical protein
MLQVSSCFACCDKESVELNKRSMHKTYRWRCCTSYLPSTSLPGNGREAAGVSAVFVALAFTGEGSDFGMLSSSAITLTGMTNSKSSASKRITRAATMRQVMSVLAESVPPNDRD